MTDAEFLRVVIQPGLPEKLGIGAGSFVIVDKVNGKFTITRSRLMTSPPTERSGRIVGGATRPGVGRPAGTTAQVDALVPPSANWKSTHHVSESAERTI